MFRPLALLRARYARTCVCVHPAPVERIALSNPGDGRSGQPEIQSASILQKSSRRHFSGYKLKTCATLATQAFCCIAFSAAHVFTLHSSRLASSRFTLHALLVTLHSSLVTLLVFTLHVFTLYVFSSSRLHVWPLHSARFHSSRLHSSLVIARGAAHATARAPASGIPSSPTNPPLR